MECKDCAYCWKTEMDSYPRCHWEPRAPGEEPPCVEQERDAEL